MDSNSLGSKHAWFTPSRTRLVLTLIYKKAYLVMPIKKGEVVMFYIFHTVDESQEKIQTTINWTVRSTCCFSFESYSSWKHFTTELFWKWNNKLCHDLNVHNEPVRHGTSGDDRGRKAPRVGLTCCLFWSFRGILWRSQKLKTAQSSSFKVAGNSSNISVKITFF